MREYYLVNDEGYIIDIYYLIKQDGVDYTKYIDIEPIGFIKPRWNGTEWEETFIRPDNITTE
jgi:hypothetical protein